MAFTLFGFQDFLREGITSNIEVGTKKEQNTYTSTNTNTYSPTITRTYDVQYNTASGGSNIGTKKDSAISQQPSTAVTPIIAVSPSQSSKSSGEGGLGTSGNESPFSQLTDSATGIIIVGLIGYGVYKYSTAGRKK